MNFDAMKYSGTNKNWAPKLIKIKKISKNDAELAQSQRPNVNKCPHHRLKHIKKINI